MNAIFLIPGEDEMDGAWMETREISLPKHYWERIEADPEVRDGELTVEEWIRRTTRSQFSYSENLDSEGGES